MNLFSNLGDFLNYFFLSFWMSSLLNNFDQHKYSFISREIINMMIDLLLYFKNVVSTKEVVSNLYFWLKNFFSKVWKITCGWSLYLQMEDASVKMLVSNQIWSSMKQTKQLSLSQNH